MDKQLMDSREIAAYVGSHNRNFAVHMARKNPAFPKPLPKVCRTAKCYYYKAEVVEWAKGYVLSDARGNRGLTISRLRSAQSSQDSLAGAKGSVQLIGVVRGKRDPLRMSTAAALAPAPWAHYLADLCYREEVRPLEGVMWDRDVRLDRADGREINVRRA